MLTIHCYHCGKDEVLFGVPGTPSTPLPFYRNKHRHNTGKQHCLIICPCGQTWKIDTREMSAPQIETHIEACYEWSKLHVEHMRQAEAAPREVVN